MRVGACARLDPDPERELSVWRRDLERGAIDDPVDTEARLSEYERGEWILVQLDLWADLGGPGPAERSDGAHVRGCWFAPGRPEQNLAHAKELVSTNLELIQIDLEAQGKNVSLAQLESLPVEITLDDSLALALERRSQPTSPSSSPSAPPASPS